MCHASCNLFQIIQWHAIQLFAIATRLREQLIRMMAVKYYVRNAQSKNGYADGHQVAEDNFRSSIGKYYVASCIYLKILQFFFFLMELLITRKILFEIFLGAKQDFFIIFFYHFNFRYNSLLFSDLFSNLPYVCRHRERRICPGCV